MMPIECKTKFTKESFRDMQYYALFKDGTRGKVMMACLIILLIIAIFMIGLSVAYGYLSGVPYAVVFLLLNLFYLMIPRILANSAFKKTPAYFDVGITYSFFDDHFTMVTTSDLINSTDEMKYRILFKVAETKDYFFLWVLQTPSLIINKNGFTSGTPEELSALFAKVLPPKKFVKKVK